MQTAEVLQEILTKTSIISEELEQERVKKQRKFQIPMSDEPGHYDPQTLRDLLRKYLSSDMVTRRRLRDVLLPSLLERKVLTREELKERLLAYDGSVDASKVGYHLTTMSSQLGMKKNDFLRQVIAYEYPNYEWEKDNFSLRDEFRGLVRDVLNDVKTVESSEHQEGRGEDGGTSPARG